MEDKQLEMARSMGSKLSNKQGGTYMNQGPKSTDGSGGKGGDSVSSPHTTHDNAMWQEGGAGRKIKSIE